MNEKLNLVEILKDCPEGTKLYSPVYGDVELMKVIQVEDEFLSPIEDDIYPIKIKLNNNSLDNFTKDGRMFEDYNGECMLFPSKDQRDWSKFNPKKPKFVPKFKVGDMIRHKETNKDDVYEISKVYDDSYGIVGFTWMIYMKYQDQYELVSNKFDPKTLQPFDKVLVKTKYGSWKCGLFSNINDEESEYKYFCVGSEYTHCIPYNDDTKHLVGTTEEAPEYYRYWED